MSKFALLVKRKQFEKKNLMISMEKSTFSLPGTDKRTCDMLEGCTALLGELYTQKAWSYNSFQQRG